MTPMHGGRGPAPRRRGSSPFDDDRRDRLRRSGRIWCLTARRSAHYGTTTFPEYASAPYLR